MHLIIDNNQKDANELQKHLKNEDEDCSCQIVDDGKNGLSCLENEKWDVVWLEADLPSKPTGLDVLEKIKTNHPDVHVIMLTDDQDTIIEAWRLQAFDVHPKPIRLDALRSILDTVLRRTQPVDLYPLPPAETDSDSPSEQRKTKIIGESEHIRDIYREIGIAAGNTMTVLIEGASGTGKELVARAIYENSERKNKPFVAIDAGATSEGLQASDLFGQVEGAFNDAKNRTGAFEAANGGTLFFDEVANMDEGLQKKLLRALETEEITRLGKNKLEPLKVDVRVIAATNQSLKEMIDRGKFREDLYYRLAQHEINVPPLRNRKEDIPLLVSHFLKLSQDELGKQICGISEKAMELIQNYTWPGNVRELKNYLKKAAQRSPTGVIMPDDLPPEILGESVATPKVSEEETQNKDRLFDLTVPVFCKFISAHGADIDYGQLIRWLDEVFPPETQVMVDAIKHQISKWEAGSPDTVDRLKEIVKSAIERLEKMKGVKGAEPINIAGKTLDEIKVDVVHEFIREYGDERKAAKALDIQLNVVEEMSNRERPKVKEIVPRELGPIPNHEIKRLLSKSIKDFLGDAISDREFRERGKKRFSEEKAEDERLRIFKLALIPLPHLFKGESGAGYICFGGMTWENEIKKEIYIRASYLYDMSQEQVAEILGVGRNTAGPRMLKNSPKNCTLFGVGDDD